MSRDLVDRYVRALTGDDVTDALATLAPDVVFQSPFNTWSGRAIGKVYRARAGAFAGLRVRRVVVDRDGAVLVWGGAVGQEQVQVQGCEVLTVREGAISRVDVYLRPADVLGPVHAAMTVAWPAS